MDNKAREKAFQDHIIADLEQVRLLVGRGYQES